MGPLPLQYGAGELRSATGRFWMLGLAISVTIHLAVVSVGSKLAVETGEPRPSIPPPRGGLTGVNVDPGIKIAGTGPELHAGRSVRHNAPGRAMPVPVPTRAVEPEAEAQEPTGSASEPGEGGADEPGTGGFVGRGTDEDVPPEPFVPVEKDPQIVRSVLPQYPPLALRAGLEGRVVAKLWVDRNGRVKQVVILKSTNELFNAAAVEAGMQFLFTPAYTNRGPVAVWVSVPFRFNLRDVKK